MKITTVSANIRYSKDIGQATWKVVELGAEASVDTGEEWQAAQTQLYTELGQQLKTLWASGNGHKAQEATTEAAEARSQPEPTKPPAHYCHEHETEFRRFEKAGKVWYSHKTQGGKWCREPNHPKP